MLLIDKAKILYMVGTYESIITKTQWYFGTSTRNLLFKSVKQSGQFTFSVYRHHNHNLILENDELKTSEN